MEDKKMDMFFAKETWEEITKIAISKKLNRELISRLCTPEHRCALLDVISSGKYDIAPPVVRNIQKDDGGFRTVFVNTDVDRIVMSIINIVYSTIYKGLIHEKCVSYQKGIGVSKIVRAILSELDKYKAFPGEVIGYKVDISKYFDSLSKECLYSSLDEIYTGSPIDDIVQKYYREDVISDEKGRVTSFYKSIAQGCAVSPFLANYCLRDIDDKISSLDVIYYRYSDDILIIGKDYKLAMKILEDMLHLKGLRINTNKLEEIKFDEWFTFLGFRIRGNNVSFSKKSLKLFQKEIKLRTKRKKGDINAVKKSIKDIQYYLYTSFLKSNENFGWGEYFFSIINIEEDIIELDMFIKDRIRSVYTAKTSVGGLGISNTKNRGVSCRTGSNVGNNKKILTNEDLKNLGYISMNHLYKLYNIDKELYRYEIRRKM